MSGRKPLPVAVKKIKGTLQACRTNPKAVGGFFLRAFVAWQQGERRAARELLGRAREARGEHWKPEGSAGEGDTARRMHRDATPLAGFWEQWDGSTEAPGETFAPLAVYLAEPPERRRLAAGGVAGA